MTEIVRMLHEIYDYCESHHITDNTCCKCVLKRACIKTDKASRYNDSRFVKKAYNKVERVLAKEREEMEQNPFVEFEELEKLNG